MQRSGGPSLRAANEAGRSAAADPRELIMQRGVLRMIKVRQALRMHEFNREERCGPELASRIEFAFGIGAWQGAQLTSTAAPGKIVQRVECGLRTA